MVSDHERSRNRLPDLCHRCVPCKLRVPDRKETIEAWWRRRQARRITMQHNWPKRDFIDPDIPGAQELVCGKCTVFMVCGAAGAIPTTQFPSQRFSSIVTMPICPAYGVGTVLSCASSHLSRHSIPPNVILSGSPNESCIRIYRLLSRIHSCSSEILANEIFQPPHVYRLSRNSRSEQRSSRGASKGHFDSILTS
jgi:hypothetical protein